MKPRKTLYFIGIGLAICVFLFMSYSNQDKPKNEIRILIDRIPNTLDLSQAPDTLAQKLFPLLKEDHYALVKPFLYEDFRFMPPDPTLPILHFIYIRDELSRSLLFQGGHTDVLFDSLSIAKTAWFKKRGTNMIEAPGFRLSFIGFNLKDPILQDQRVRRAIQLSLPVSEWAHDKLFDWVTLLPEVPLEPDLVQANRLLDEAGHPKDASGLRFLLHYQTTPVREGYENALLIREALKGIGIRLEVKPIETSLFFNRLLHGEFQVFATTINRNTPDDPVSDFLRPSGQKNYFHYNRLPDRVFAWDEVKMQVFQDLPIIPLFNWKHSAVLSDRITALPGAETKLDDSFRFLTLLRIK